MSRQTPQEEYLYHYTSAQAIIGMTQHRKFWATHNEYLNDGLEGQQVTRILRTMAETPAVYGTGAVVEKHRAAFLSHLRRGRSFYVASFSRRYNMLTQFRLYSPPRGGFVVGFPADYLAKLGTLGEVCYDREQITAWCRDFFGRYVQQATEIDRNDLTADALAYDIDNSGPWVDERAWKSIMCKSSEFATEEEFRVVATGHVETCVRASAAGNLFVPYVELDMPNEDITIKVAAGPGPLVQLANRSVSTLNRLRDRAGTKWQIAALSIGEFGYRDV